MHSTEVGCSPRGLPTSPCVLGKGTLDLAFLTAGTAAGTRSFGYCIVREAQVSAIHGYAELSFNIIQSIDGGIRGVTLW